MPRKQWITSISCLCLIIALVGGIVGSFVGLEQGFIAGLTAGLVYVTAIYAYLTSKIAEATNNQAESSRKMLEEVKEERLATSRPILIQKPIIGWERDNVWYNYLLHFLVMNAGNGSAIEFEVVLLDDKRQCLEAIRDNFLKSGEEIKFSPDLTRLEERNYSICCQYISISHLTGEKTFNQTWLPFKVLKLVNKGELVIETGKLSFNFGVLEKDLIDAFRTDVIL